MGKCTICDAAMGKRECYCGTSDSYCTGCGQWGSFHAHAPDNSNVRVF